MQGSVFAGFNRFSAVHPNYDVTCIVEVGYRCWIRHSARPFHPQAYQGKSENENVLLPGQTRCCGKGHAPQLVSPPKP